MPIISNVMERFARRCDITGKGMNQGWVIGPMNLYVADEENMIKELRKVDDIPKEFPADKLRDYLYGKDYFFYTEWNEGDIEEQGYYYTEDGSEIQVNGNFTISEYRFEDDRYIILDSEGFDFDGEHYSYEDAIERVNELNKKAH